MCAYSTMVLRARKAPEYLTCQMSSSEMSCRPVSTFRQRRLKPVRLGRESWAVGEECGLPGVQMVQPHMVSSSSSSPQSRSRTSMSAGGSIASTSWEPQLEAANRAIATASPTTLLLVLEIFGGELGKVDTISYCPMPDDPAPGSLRCLNKIVTPVDVFLAGGSTCRGQIQSPPN